MGRQAEAMAQRLRRLARALVQDSEGADVLVVATLSASMLGLMAQSGFPFALSTTFTCVAS